MTTEEIIALDKLRMQAQAAYETPYCRLNAEDIKDIIEFVLHCPKLRKRLKDIIKDSRKEMADAIMQQRQTDLWEELFPSEDALINLTHETDR